jgi:hypothetical protein
MDTTIRLKKNSKFTSAALENHFIDVPTRGSDALERNGLHLTQPR